MAGSYIADTSGHVVSIAAGTDTGVSDCSGTKHAVIPETVKQTIASISNVVTEGIKLLNIVLLVIILLSHIVNP